MTTRMIDAITVTRDEIYKGAARLVMSDPDTLTSFPGRMESVMNLSTYALVTGWIDLGPTNEDGVTVRRAAEVSEGIPLDQRQTNLDEGEPESWSMEAESTLIHTSLANFQKAWEGGTLRAHAADGSYAAQHALDLDAPSTWTERMAVFIQEDPKSGKLRMFAFRKTVPQVDGEVTLKSKEATGLPLKLKLREDTSVSIGYGQFGKIFEED
jgi:hypothetical protein